MTWRSRGKAASAPAAAARPQRLVKTTVVKRRGDRAGRGGA